MLSDAPLTIALPSAPTCCKPMLAAVFWPGRPNVKLTWPISVLN